MFIQYDNTLWVCCTVHFTGLRQWQSYFECNVLQTGKQMFTLPWGMMVQCGYSHSVSFAACGSISHMIWNIILWPVLSMTILMSNVNINAIVFLFHCCNSRSLLQILFSKTLLIKQNEWVIVWVQISFSRLFMASYVIQSDRVNKSNPQTTIWSENIYHSSRKGILLKL